MDWMEMLAKIFEVCIIPLLGILTAYLVAFIKAKGNEILTHTDNELEQKYLSMLIDTVSECVIATNQTYVEALKKEGRFDETAQKIAFQKTLTAVLAILTDEAKVYLSEAVGDLEKYIYNLIEYEVNMNK